ncbi:hypothetical protein NDA16_000799 [Ustilago loliicola]|nr:hypothetical protein NDA16_000799 [Ustilago loliicola]
MALDDADKDDLKKVCDAAVRAWATASQSMSDAIARPDQTRRIAQLPSPGVPRRRAPDLANQSTLRHNPFRQASADDDDGRYLMQGGADSYDDGDAYANNDAYSDMQSYQYDDRHHRSMHHLGRSRAHSDDSDFGGSDKDDHDHDHDGSDQDLGQGQQHHRDQQDDDEQDMVGLGLNDAPSRSASSPSSPKRRSTSNNNDVGQVQQPSPIERNKRQGSSTYSRPDRAHRNKGRQKKLAESLPRVNGKFAPRPPPTQHPSEERLSDRDTRLSS